MSAEITGNYYVDEDVLKFEIPELFFPFPAWRIVCFPPAEKRNKTRKLMITTYSVPDRVMFDGKSRRLCELDFFDNPIHVALYNYKWD